MVRYLMLLLNLFIHVAQQISARLFSGPNKGDAFRKKPTKEANWKDLLRDIEEFKYGFGGKLKKIKTDDRSKPMLAKTKKGDKVCYIQVPSEAKIFQQLNWASYLDFLLAATQVIYQIGETVDLSSISFISSLCSTTKVHLTRGTKTF